MFGGTGCIKGVWAGGVARPDLGRWILFVGYLAYVAGQAPTSQFNVKDG